MIEVTASILLVCSSSSLLDAFYFTLKLFKSISFTMYYSYELSYRYLEI